MRGLKIQIPSPAAVKRVHRGFILSLNFTWFGYEIPNIFHLQATNRWEAIDELIHHLVETGKIKSENQAAITAVVKKREASMSTAIGFDMAIPHASTNLVAEVGFAMGRSPGGIEFGAFDGKPVYKVLLFLVPAGQFQTHAATLAKMVHRLHRE